MKNKAKIASKKPLLLPGNFLTVPCLCGNFLTVPCLSVAVPGSSFAGADVPFLCSEELGVEMFSSLPCMTLNPFA
jgi:hypothetical protein